MDFIFAWLVILNKSVITCDYYILVVTVLHLCALLIRNPDSKFLVGT